MTSNPKGEATSPLRIYRYLLVAILAGYFILGVIYSLATPVLEASDEVSHYPFVKQIADGRGLPIQDPAVPTLWKQEGSQPPLYYALAALVTKWIDTDDLASVRWWNPHVAIGQPLSVGNKNMIIHTDREAFPWTGTALAVHLARFLSLLLQSATVLLTYALALEVIPARRDLALGAAALVAFNPMFLFIAASVNNDNLIVPLAALVLWLLARTLREGWLSYGRAILLGVVLGLAALSKLTGLALLVLTAGVLVVVAWRRRGTPRCRGKLFQWGAIIGALVLLIAGWWYVRNWQLYGDPTGLNVMLAIAGRRRQIPSWRGLLGEFQGFYMSYWGVFGAFTVVADERVYRFYRILGLLGLVGWIPLAWRYWRRWREAQVLWVVAAWAAIVIVSLINWTRQTRGSQGRLIFPAISAIAVLLTYGLAGWLPRRWQGRGLAMVGGLLAILAAAIPFWVIRPAYAKPPLLTREQVPSTATPVDVVHAGTLRLLAYELPQDTVRPGEGLPVTVYWQSVAPTDRNLSVFVHLLGRGGDLVGQSASYPGLGAYATSQLRPGDVLRDTYRVPVSRTASAPSLVAVDVGLFEYQGGGEVGLPAADSTGQPATGPIGSVRLLPGPSAATFQIDRPMGEATLGEVASPLHFDLGGQAALIGYSLTPEVVAPGETMTVTLFWQGKTRMSEDYTVFVHLVSPDGGILAQQDNPPLGGDWPTRAWEPGYTVPDVYELAIPAGVSSGTYELRVGMYRPSDGWRLPVRGPAGQVRDNAMILGSVVVR